MKDINIYFHTPYCKAKCRFCSFYVIPGRKSRIDEYFTAIKKEIDYYKNNLTDYQVKTIYAGGGTPSLVEANYLTEIINYIKENLNVSVQCEISVEANPETIDEDKITAYSKVGVNRISIGLQAWQNEILKFLGRLYTVEEFKEKYSIVKNSSIKNINVDLIFAIPGLSFKDWEESLNNLIELEPTHISAYSLEVDVDSIFGYLQRKGRFTPVDDITDRKMYRTAKKILKQNNFNQYEISNFAKSGFECKHNRNIWEGQDYIGLGASSHSRFKNQRYSNVNSIEKYLDLISLQGNAEEDIRDLNKSDMLLERIILNLRLNKGIDIKKISKDFNVDFLETYKTNIEKLSNQKLITFDGNIKLTEKGQDLENIVALEFI